MTVSEFALAVVTVRRRYHGYVTSWGRTDARSIAVGGFAGDPHTWDLGVDMNYGQGLLNRPGSEGHPRMPKSCPLCSEEGLKCIHELLCDHYQPADFQRGPVLAYAGVTKDWA